MLDLIAIATALNSAAIILLWLKSNTSEKLVVHHAETSLQTLNEQCEQMRHAIKSASNSSVVKADLVLEWRAKLASLPVGSPRHTAYKNRLAEIDRGELKVE